MTTTAACSVRARLQKLINPLIGEYQRPMLEDIQTVARGDAAALGGQVDTSKPIALLPPRPRCKSEE